MNRFASVIRANHSRYFCSNVDADLIYDSTQAFDVGYAIANNATTRTVDTVARKDTLRNSAEAICRQFAGMIKRSGGISDDHKIAAGVPPINRNREQRLCPQTGITLSIVASTQGAHTLNYINTLVPTKKAKVLGAVGVELFMAIAPGPIMDVDEARFYRRYTKNPMAVFFNPSEKGKFASYFARYTGIRGDTGPFSPGVSMPIAA